MQPSFLSILRLTLTVTLAYSFTGSVGDTVVAAVVAGAVSLVVTLGKVLWDHRTKVKDRQLAARERLSRYREPLLAAADDLGSRINNMRNDGFLAYLTVDGRERTALLGTLFRFAQFFGWTEICFGNFDRLRFADDKSTRVVASTLKTLSKTLAVDRLDRADPASPAATRLMIWREEQRAIGELMRAEDEPPRCIGFNSFTKRFDAELAPWFLPFASQLNQAETPSSERLAEVQRLLARLICELDVDGLLVKRDRDGVVTEPRWAQPGLIEGRVDRL